MPLEDAYVPDVIPTADVEYFEKGGFGGRLGWGETPALLVVDLTEEFTSGEFSLGRSDVGDAVVEATARLLEAAREAGLPVFFTKPDGDLPPAYPGTAKEPDGGDRAAERQQANVIREEIAPRDDERVIEKPRASAFFDTHLASELHHHGVDTAIVTGMTTSGCIRASVVDAYSSNVRPIVPIECVGDRSTVSHEVSLFDMDMKYADVTPMSDVVSEIRGTAVSVEDRSGSR